MGLQRGEPGAAGAGSAKANREPQDGLRPIGGSPSLKPVLRAPKAERVGVVKTRVLASPLALEAVPFAPRRAVAAPGAPPGKMAAVVAVVRAILSTPPRVAMAEVRSPRRKAAETVPVRV